MDPPPVWPIPGYEPAPGRAVGFEKHVGMNGETYLAGRTVFIGLRVHNPVVGKVCHVRGLTIRAYDFSPQEVHDIIVRALKAAARRYQKRTKAPV
jgi:hypothetical protein